MTHHPLTVLLGLLGRDESDPICICHKSPGDTGPMGYTWTTTAQAHTVAERYAGREHVWFGVQPMNPPIGTGRGTSKDVIAFRTLYADLDFKVEGKTTGMDPVDAMDIIDELSTILGERPTAVVNSGYGLQPYWPLDTDADVVDGALMLARWRQVVISVAAAHGCTVDTGVYDLPRILRVPGPPNLKYGKTAGTMLSARPEANRLTLTEVNAALDAYAPVTEQLKRAHASNIVRARGDVPDNGHTGDRVFNDAEAMNFIEEYALRRARETPWGGGADYWKVIWESALTLSNFTEMYDEDDLKDMLRLAVASGHDGTGTDAADEYQIAMGFAKGREWLARRPNAADESDAFGRHYAGEIRLATGPEEELGATEYDIVNADGIVVATSDMSVDVLTAGETGTGDGGRRLQFTPASEIGMEACYWLWEHEDEYWIPLGGLVLLGGREGVGKSTWTARLVAQVTRGKMKGEFLGKPKGVVICATEDSWTTTINPRLKAAGADLDRVYRAEAAEGEHTQGLMLPKDVTGLTKFVAANDVAMIVLDPLLGTVERALDTHKDADVRQALEPISRLAADSRVTVLGLIHQNKNQSGDLLTRMMGSRAFSAVARAVLICAEAGAPLEAGEFDPMAVPDPVAPKAPRSFLFGQLKNNLGPRVDTSVRYEIETSVLDNPNPAEKTIRTSKVKVTSYKDETDVEESVLAKEKAQRSTASKKSHATASEEYPIDKELSLTKVEQAMACISDFMSASPNGMQAGQAVKALESSGFTYATYNRARAQLGITSKKMSGGNWVWTFSK